MNVRKVMVWRVVILFNFMLKANYKKIGDSIISTITTYPLRFAKITGDSTPYKIKSFKEQQVQRAVLKRMK